MAATSKHYPHQASPGNGPIRHQWLGSEVALEKATKPPNHYKTLENTKNLWNNTRTNWTQKPRTQ